MSKVDDLQTLKSSPKASNIENLQSICEVCEEEVAASSVSSNDQTLERSCLFQQFPNEILLNIFAHLGKPSLKQVRLVCRQWSSLPIKFLFHRIFISHHNKDLDVFSQITENPTISACFTELVFELSCFDLGLKEHKYFQILQGQLSTFAERVSLRDISGDADEQVKKFITYLKTRTATTDDYNFERPMREFRFVKRGYAKYVELRQHQEWNRANRELEIRLCIGLKSLSRLKHVRFSNEWDTSNWLYQDYDLCRFRSRFLRGSPFARSYHPLWVWPQKIQPDANSEFSTMIHILTLVNIQIKSLSTQGLSHEAFTGSLGAKGTLIEDMQISLCQLEELSLCCNGGTIKSSLGSIADLPVALRSMKRLKCLRINFNADDKPEPDLYILKDILGSRAPRFLYLTDLYLTSVKCDSSDLVTCLRRQAKLSTLLLSGVELSQGYWVSMFDFMHHNLNIKKFILIEPLLEVGGIEVWNNATMDGEELRLDLEAFVLEGGANPLPKTRDTPVSDWSD